MDENLQRKLRKLASELEHGNDALRPPRAVHRRAVKVRHGAAGFGMAACIAAAIVLFTQLLPGADESGALRPAATGSESPGSTTAPEDRESTPTGAPTWVPEPTTPPDPDQPTASPTKANPTWDATPRPNTHGDIYPQSERKILPCPGEDKPKPPPDGISVTASARPDEGTPGAGQMTLGVVFRNERSQPADNAWGPPKASFHVFDASGALVYDSTAGKAYPAPLYMDSVEPGGERRYEEPWDMVGCPDKDGRAYALPAGDYTVRAWWRSASGGWSEPVKIRIS